MAVECVVQCLANLGVIERGLAHVHAHQAVAKIGHLGGHHIGNARQCVDGDRVNRRKELIGAAGHAGLACAGLGHDIELEPGEFWQASHMVVGVFDQTDIGICHPCVELERPGSHRHFLQARRIDQGLGGHDRQRLKLADQGQRGGVQVDHHIALVGQNLLDHRQPRRIGRAGLGITHPRQRGHHIGSHHGLAVVKLNPRLELEAVAQTIFGDGPGSGKRGHDLEVPVDRGQAFVNVLVNQHRVKRRHHMGVQAGGRTIGGDLQNLRAGQASPGQASRPGGKSPGQWPVSGAEGGLGGGVHGVSP